MKKHKILLGIIASILILFLVSYIRIDLDDLNGTGELQNTFISPNKEYKAESFLINKGGATVGFQERVSITSLSDNKKAYNDNTIYWLYPSENELSIEWKNNNIIVINGQSIDINDEDTYYNWKKDDNL